MDQLPGQSVSDRRRLRERLRGGVRFSQRGPTCKRPLRARIGRYRLVSRNPVRAIGIGPTPEESLPPKKKQGNTEAQRTQSELIWFSLRSSGVPVSLAVFVR